MNALVQSASFAASAPLKSPDFKPRSVTPEQIARITSVVGVDMELHGQYVSKSADAGLCIEGIFQGSIKFAEGGVVRIAAGANVTDSEVEADIVLIEGNFTGTVRARTLIEVLPCATVEGSIHYADLDMHRGSRVKAELITMEANEGVGSENASASSNHADANHSNGNRNFVAKLSQQLTPPSTTPVPSQAAVSSAGPATGLSVVKADS